MDKSVVRVLPVIAHSTESQEDLTKVTASVVSIVFSYAYSFDTETAGSSEGTGFVVFVVDAEKGYILTNRVRIEERAFECWANEVVAYSRARSIFGILQIRKPRGGMLSFTEVRLHISNLSISSVMCTQSIGTLYTTLPS